jgi:hypothetical protein
VEVLALAIREDGSEFQQAILGFLLNGTKAKI